MNPVTFCGTIRCGFGVDVFVSEECLVVYINVEWSDAYVKMFLYVITTLFRF
jgi:hypothetical protein